MYYGLFINRRFKKTNSSANIRKIMNYYVEEKKCELRLHRSYNILHKYKSHTRTLFCSVSFYTNYILMLFNYNLD